MQEVEDGAGAAADHDDDDDNEFCPGPSSRHLRRSGLIGPGA
jgi:hypothetical protein